MLFAAALFILTQVLFGFHHHQDDDHHPDDGGTSAVECSLCLAAIHHPADVSPQPAFHLFEQAPQENTPAPRQPGKIAVEAPANPPRAPPAAHSRY